ncbi:MAG: hypothetical protein ACRC62_38920 [Microcoleus sp.]
MPVACCLEGRGKKEEGRRKKLQTASDRAFQILRIIRWTYLVDLHERGYIVAEFYYDRPSRSLSNLG